MRSQFYTTTLLCVLLSLLPIQQARATLPAANVLLDSLIHLLIPENSQGIIQQEIETTSGSLRTLEYDSYTGGGGANSLLRYRSPARVKGNAMLMKNFSDDIWMYNRRTNRVRKLASHARRQKFEGSDFTYEDMSSGDSWKEDYTPSLGDPGKIRGEKCRQLILNRTSDDVSYSRLVCWLREDDLYPVQIDYYDAQERLYKKLILENIRVIDGQPVAMKMTMQNIPERTQTVMQYLELTFDVKFPEHFFSERELKR